MLKIKLDKQLVITVYNCKLKVTANKDRSFNVYVDFTENGKDSFNNLTMSATLDVLANNNITREELVKLLKYIDDNKEVN
jgi:hypothetical protein